GLKALTSALRARPDRAVVNQAVLAAHQLDDMDRCADARALLFAVPLPAGTAAQARVADLELRLGTAAALLRLGRHKEALAQARPLLDEIRGAGYAPLEARAKLLMAHLLERNADYKSAEALYRESIDAAARAKDDELAVSAWTSYLFLVGEIERKHDE